MRRFISIITAIAALPAAVPASASETVTYGYDARGRLVSVVRAGPAARTAGYSYDKANNRTVKTASP